MKNEEVHCNLSLPSSPQVILFFFSKSGESSNGNEEPNGTSPYHRGIYICNLCKICETNQSDRRIAERDSFINSTSQESSPARISPIAWRFARHAGTVSRKVIKNMFALRDGPAWHIRLAHLVCFNSTPDDRWRGGVRIEGEIWRNVHWSIPCAWPKKERNPFTSLMQVFTLQTNTLLPLALQTVF